ncbi:MAG: NAD(P)/FAD-dependent oxidoreductase [Sphingomonadales bacterium]|nr:NAD(P)/FAD-dependent oxidoreductase [Sphingomonadales bacterium]
MYEIDALVAGAGVVGLAVARALQLVGLETIVVDREGHFGSGISSRNSEVIHAGIYYPAGSAKARHCVRGKNLLYEFCERRGVAHRRIGKVIVAATPDEVGRLEDYAAHGKANGVDDLAWLAGAEVRDLEPAVRAEAGLLSPSTGIVDSHGYMQALLHDLESEGGHFVRNAGLDHAEARPDGRIFVRLADGSEVLVRWLVNACGLDAPALARRIGGLDGSHVPTPHFAIGHYYVLAGANPFRRLVYPIAPPGGLGVHVTLDLGGAAKFGPDVRWIDTIDYSFDDSRKQAFVDAISRYYPAIKPEDLLPGYTGIRPKISARGEPDADFLVQGPAIHGVPGLVNLFGIESPGLTSSLSIAEEVASLTAAG